MTNTEPIMTNSATIGDSATGRQGIDDVLRRIYDAWAAGDADAFADCYTPDATVAMPGSYKGGREQVRTYMAAAFAGPLSGSTGVDEPMNVRILGDTAVVVSEAGILMAGETELPADRRRLATWVLVREAAGDWRVAAYHNCPA